MKASFLLSSVRLACVKHAASVHPEPGSNSQIKFVLNRIYVWHNFASLFWFSLNRARSFIRNHLVISDCFLENLIVTALQSVFEFSRLSNYPIFKVRLRFAVAPLLVRQQDIYYHLAFPLSTPFFYFFLWSLKPEKNAFQRVSLLIILQTI